MIENLDDIPATGSSLSIRRAIFDMPVLKDGSLVVIGTSVYVAVLNITPPGDPAEHALKYVRELPE